MVLERNRVAYAHQIWDPRSDAAEDSGIVSMCECLLMFNSIAMPSSSGVRQISVLLGCVIYDHSCRTLMLSLRKCISQIFLNSDTIIALATWSLKEIINRATLIRR